MTRGHAQRAIDALNGTTIGGRTIAVDWAVSKHTHHAGEEGAAEEGADIDDDVTEDERSSDGEDGGFDREMQGDVQHGSKGMHSILQEVLKNKGEGDSDMEEEEEDGYDIDNADDGDDAEELSEYDDAEDPVEESDSYEQPPTTTTTTQPTTHTVFVRGLPLDATQRLLLQRLGVFGHITSCRLVRDKAAGGQLKGTAFVEYGKQEAAQRAVDASAKARCGNAGGQHSVVSLLHWSYNPKDITHTPCTQCWYRSCNYSGWAHDQYPHSIEWATGT